MASGLTLLEAKAEQKVISLASIPCNVHGSLICNLFMVKVPVLSEHKMVIPANSSMATKYKYLFKIYLTYILIY